MPIVIKNKYFWMFLIGGVFTTSYFLTLIPGMPTWGDAIINVLVMLGSGVFCSALVSVLLEHQNNVRAREEMRRSKRYILSSMKSRLFRLHEVELRCLSSLYNKYLDAPKKPYIKKNLTMTEIYNQISFLLNELEKLEGDPSSSADMTTISSETIKFDKTRLHLMVSEPITYYMHLYEAMDTILMDRNSYLLMGVFTAEQLTDFENVAHDLRTVNSFLTEQGMEERLVIGFKLNFFKNVNECLASFEFEEDETIDCHFREYSYSQ